MQCLMGRMIITYQRRPLNIFIGKYMRGNVLNQIITTLNTVHKIAVMNHNHDQYQHNTR